MPTVLSYENFEARYKELQNRGKKIGKERDKKGGMEVLKNANCIEL